MTSAAAEPEDPTSLRAERDAWEARARSAEARAQRLADELDAVRRGSLGLFDEVAAPEPEAALAADGTDPRLLSLALGAVALVMAMVALLSLVNNGLFSVATVVMVLVTAGLGYAAWQLRVVTPKVTVVKSVVLVEQKGQTSRFDLRNEGVSVEVVGRAGSPGWCVRFRGRGLSETSIDAASVEPVAFMERLREWRPEL